MSSKFRTVDRHTLYLLPPSVQDWLPDDHLARFVVDIVERLDLSALERQYSGGGKDPYHPALLLGLLFHGYATGVFSSRKLERATCDSVAFRHIAANSHPDHDTIASFRKCFLKELRGLFVQILLIAQEAGLLKLGNVSLDGTKVQANASKHKALSWGYAKRLGEQLRAEVSALLEQAARADDSEPELDIPEELKRRTERLAVIEAARVEIERRARERHAAERVYCARGDAENRLKELKLGLEIDRTSCTRFLANQFRVPMTAAAYVLMRELRLKARWTSRARSGRHLAVALAETGRLDRNVGTAHRHPPAARHPVCRRLAPHCTLGRRGCDLIRSSRLV